jgi:hypothetical protein
MIATVLFAWARRAESRDASLPVQEEGPAEGPARDGPGKEGAVAERPENDEAIGAEGPAAEGPAEERPTSEGWAENGARNRVLERPAEEEEGPAEEGESARDRPARDKPEPEGPAEDGPAADDEPTTHPEGPAEEAPVEGPAMDPAPVAIVAEEAAAGEAARFFATYEGFFDFFSLRVRASSDSRSGDGVIVVRAVTNDAGVEGRDEPADGAKSAVAGQPKFEELGGAARGGGEVVEAADR